MPAESKALSETRCPQCGAPMSMSIDGLCAACLMRLATSDSPAGNDDQAQDPSLPDAAPTGSGSD